MHRFGFLEDALLVAGRNGLIRRRLADGSFQTYADLSGISDKPWNDMVVDGGGNIYIGNIGFDCPGGEFRPGLVALLAADGSARCVRVDEGGNVLQTLELDRGCFACALGGQDRATLFMLAANYPPTSSGPNAERTGQVLTIQAPAPRAGWP